MNNIIEIVKKDYHDALLSNNINNIIKRHKILADIDKSYKISCIELLNSIKDKLTIKSYKDLTYQIIDNCDKFVIEFLKNDYSNKVPEYEFVKLFYKKIDIENNKFYHFDMGIFNEYSLLMNLIINKKFELALEFIETEYSNPEYVNIYGCTALILASLYSNVCPQLAFALLNTKKSNPMQMLTYDNITHNFSFLGIFANTLGNNMRQNTIDALYLACCNKSVVVAEEILKYIPFPTVVDDRYYLLLLSGCYSNMHNFVKSLSDNEFDDNHVLFNYILFYASENKMFDIIMTIICNIKK